MKRLSAFFLSILFFIVGCTPQQPPAASPMHPNYIDEAWNDKVFGQYYTDSIAQKVPYDHFSSYTAYNADLRKVDLTEDDYTLICFDTNTRFPKDLPDTFDPAAEIELGKDPGLGIRDLHAEGITGKGVNIGIIDQPLVPHVEYEGKLYYYRNQNPNDTNGSMHGAAVLSIAVGETVGVAPDAQVYYMAAASDAGFMQNDMNALTELLELNRTLSEEEKLNIITISQAGYDDSLYAEMKTMCAEQDVALLTCKDMNVFGPIGRGVDTDPNDPTGVLPCALYTYGAGNAWQGTSEHPVCIPIDRRTVASMSGSDSYYHMTFGGVSWIPPYVAGVYALAKEVRPALTFSDFEQLAIDTTRKVSVSTASGTAYTFHVLDPAGIIAILKK